jgi:enoyl-CoA hydratase/carnithine racemase
MPQAYYEQHDDVGELVLDAPPLNLFGPAMFDDLEAANRRDPGRSAARADLPRAG